MVRIIQLFLVLSSLFGFAQNNFIVTLEDGRRVLLKDNHTWEFIDAVPSAPQVVKPATPIEQPQIQSPPLAVVEKNCGYGPNFAEPKLDAQIQAHLKRSRATMEQLKKKVAKDFDCATAAVVLLSLSETKAKGSYTFCAAGTKIQYKRVGNSFFKKGKLF